MRSVFGGKIMQKKKSLEIFDRDVWEKHNIPPFGGEGGMI